MLSDDRKPQSRFQDLTGYNAIKPNETGLGLEQKGWRAIHSQAEVLTLDFGSVVP